MPAISLNTNTPEVLDGSIDDHAYYRPIYQADPKRIDSDPEYWKSRRAGWPRIHRTKRQWPAFLADQRDRRRNERGIARPEKYAGYVRLNLNVPCLPWHHR